MSVTATRPPPIIPPSLSSGLHHHHHHHHQARITIQRRPSSFLSFVVSARASSDSAFSSSHLKLTGNGYGGLSRNTSLRCNCSTGPAGPGENENKDVLDAFFLGKALAEAVSERLESTVGEILSAVGRLQAEQQKQVQDFQEEVLERAKRAKERAAREAIEARGLIPKSPGTEVTTVDNGTTTSSTSSSTTNNGSPAISPTSNSGAQPSSTTDIDPIDILSNED